MRTVTQLREWAGRQWQRRWPEWLASGSDGAAWPLHPPTQQELLADADALAREVTAWRLFAAKDGVTVTWVQRRLGAFGSQALPARVSLTPAAVARLVGEAARWERAQAAVDHLVASWPELAGHPVIKQVAKGLGALTEEDLVRLLAVLGWLATHPHEPVWERAVPVQGIDTKWVERHRGVVVALSEAILGAAAPLRRVVPRFTVRIGSDLGAYNTAGTLADLITLPERPRVVLIVENLVSLLMLPNLPGVMAVHGMGFAAPTLAEVPWVAGAEQWYWGDLDTYGFQILGQVRAALPDVRSLMMDSATFEANREFAVEEPRPFRGAIGYLTADEHRALSLVREVDGRLEQERLPEAFVADQLESLFSQPATS